jgi:EAL domain-containing protein (putative c-di-GMP-specific phosphodiesterase class I)/AmiR/NasT family two-component response regulator
MPDPQNRILLLDDDPAILRAYTKVLTSHGWNVETAPDGAQAIQKLRGLSFGAIVSDVSMPQMGGLDFLRIVREHDLDVPVILMTGQPELDSAMRAVEYGAFRYLLKPIDAEVLDETVRCAVRLHEMARLKREALETVGVERGRLGDRAGLEARFAMALNLFWMAYQPIVSVRQRSVFGYEALLRCYEPTLPTPGEVLNAAERLGRVHDLGRAIRARVATEADNSPEGVKTFVNLHALDLNDEKLYATDSSFARMATRSVLEITERVSLDGVKDVVSRVKRLRAMGFQIAVDDLGAGYAGLSSYSQLEPDIAKIDMSLVRDIDSSPRKQSIVRSMKKLCDELGTVVVAEGVETRAECNVLVELGCDLLQGYLFAKPDRGFPPPQWPEEIGGQSEPLLREVGAPAAS